MRLLNILDILISLIRDDCSALLDADCSDDVLLSLKVKFEL